MPAFSKLALESSAFFRLASLKLAFQNQPFHPLCHPSPPIFYVFQESDLILLSVFHGIRLESYQCFVVPLWADHSDYFTHIFLSVKLKLNRPIP